MRIGEIAEQAGVPTKTIRYYESIGLLAPPERSSNSYRDYGDDVVDRLTFIRAAQSSGFTLGEIRSILALRSRGEAPCAHVRDLIDRRAGEIALRITELERMRSDLRRLARRAKDLDPAECDPAAICHIIKTTRLHP